MEQNKLNAQLIQFAVATLNILEEDKEWSGDTTDAICETAVLYKLTKKGTDGFFTSILNEKE